ncbi:MAG: NAD(P)-binding domain-containing protein [bacterium JZ-2024 1]
MSDVAVFGTGLMGSRIARRLLKCGFSVTVWNRTPDKARALAKEGAIVAEIACEAGQQAPVWIFMLADPNAVRQVLFGDRALREVFREGLIILDMSTVHSLFSVEMNGQCSAFGVKYVDAPVLGSLKPAEEGTLQIFLGAGEADLAPVRPILSSLGRALYFLGKPGQGSALKMAMNLYLGVSMAGLAEIVAFARSAGIPDSVLMKVVDESVIFDESRKAKLRKVIETGDYAPGFPLKWMAKDLRLLQETCEVLNLSLPISETTRRVFEAAVAQSRGDLDYSAIMDDYAKTAGAFYPAVSRGVRDEWVTLKGVTTILEQARARTHRVLDQFPRQHTERRPRDGLPSCVQIVMRIAVIERTILAGIQHRQWDPEALSIPEIYHFETAVEYLKETRAQTNAWLSENEARLTEIVTLPSGRQPSVAEIFLDLADREASLRGQIIAYGLIFGARFRDVPF